MSLPFSYKLLSDLWMNWRWINQFWEIFTTGMFGMVGRKYRDIVYYDFSPWFQWSLSDLSNSAHNTRKRYKKLNCACYYYKKECSPQYSLPPNHFTSIHYPLTHKFSWSRTKQLLSLFWLTHIYATFGSSALSHSGASVAFQDCCLSVSRDPTYLSQ